MPTRNCLLTSYDSEFDEAAGAYGPNLEYLTQVEKSQLLMVIGDWVHHCAVTEQGSRNSLHEHIDMTDPFDMYDCDAAKMVEQYLDFMVPAPALQLAIALSWQLIEGVYAPEPDDSGDDYELLDLSELLEAEA
jgi:hypothetical protein